MTDSKRPLSGAPGQEDSGRQDSTAADSPSPDAHTAAQPTDRAALDLAGDVPPSPKAPVCPSPEPTSGPPFFPHSPVLAELAAGSAVGGPQEPRLLTEDDLVTTHRRRVKLPLTLFIITCLSTFWAGATHWEPSLHLGNVQAGKETVSRLILDNGSTGLIYMACVLAILLTHEMGHFLATVRYRIPASYPFFIPVPITPIGTMGAVIGMDGLRANRKEMFDIGLAGPIAGLVVAVPILWIGITQLDFTQPATGQFEFDCPLLARLMLARINPHGYQPGLDITSHQLNPYFMAGWVGLLITGLNMLPVSQLDGGHVLYTLFGKQANWIARGFLFLAIVLIVTNWQRAWIWTPMIVLVTLIGADHPPTADDNMPLGWFRTTLGLVSLMIPILCFPPFGLREAGM